MKTIPLLLVLAAVAFPSQAATYGQKVVAAVLMAEAWSEGEVGMMAVAEVIHTRAQTACISPLAVVKSSRQFSCLNWTTPDALYERFARNKDYPKALEISRRLYNEPQTLPGYSRGATHFTKRTENPVWAVGKQPIVVIGRHAFYKL
jgi:N-acetylmuramoyl-L-alanine amidase